jgi:drug/metabolite transporter (DMT)-like permease
MVASLTNAIAMLGLHRLRGIHPWAIVTHYSGVATLFVLGTWVLGGMPDLTPLQEPRTWLFLVGVGAMATLGQVFVTLAFTWGQPARVSVVGLMQIIFALGLDLIFEGPHFHILTLVGIALVLAPTAWMMMDRAGRASPPATPGNIPADSDRTAAPIQPAELEPTTGPR